MQSSWLNSFFLIVFMSICVSIAKVPMMTKLTLKAKTACGRKSIYEKATIQVTTPQTIIGIMMKMTVIHILLSSYFACFINIAKDNVTTITG